MQPTPAERIKKPRNQTIDIMKIIISFFVVFHHVPFPTIKGEIIQCIARCTVPFFFAVSGFFSLGINAQKAATRMKRSLLLFAGAYLYYYIVRVYMVVWQGGDLGWIMKEYAPGTRIITEWFILNSNPFSQHIWFVEALAFCYMVMWFYTKFYGQQKPQYKTLYIVSICLFGVGLSNSVFATAVGAEVYNPLYRNAWFYGIPMFSIGLFLREYYDTIFTNFGLTGKRLLGITLFGFALALVEWRGIGYCDIQIGNIVAGVGLMLLSTVYPTVAAEESLLIRTVRKLDGLSTWIYVTHMGANDMYTRFLQTAMDAKFGYYAGYLRPLVVVVIAIVTYFPFMWVMRLFRKKRK